MALPVLALGCSRSELELAAPIGELPARSVPPPISLLATKVVTPLQVPATDLRELASAELLYALFDAEEGVSISPKLLAKADTPEVTLSGKLDQTLGLRIKCQSDSLFSWSTENGWGWANGIGVVDVAIPIGGSLELGDTGITAHFPDGSYAAGHDYWAVTERVRSLGPVADCDLDNSSVYPSNGLLIERWGMNNRLPALIASPPLRTGAIGNQSALASLVSGENTPFEVWELCAIRSMNISTRPVAGWCFSNSVDAEADYLDSLWYGPDAEGHGYVVRRRAAGAEIVAASAAVPLDLSWRVRRTRFDGSSLQVSVNGLDLFEAPVTWESASLVCDRFLLGGIKLGSDEATPTASNIPYAAFNKWAGYSGLLSDSQARENWKAFA